MKNFACLFAALLASIVPFVAGVLMEIAMQILKFAKNVLIAAYLKVLDWIEEVATVDKSGGPTAGA